MKLINPIKPKQLLPLALSVVPVMGEMTINNSGLPTPWPIALVSAGISMFSWWRVKDDNKNKADDDDKSLGKLTIALAIYNFIRSLLRLVGSWNSLRVNGLEGFEYAESALFPVIALIPLIDILDSMRNLDQRKRLITFSYYGILTLTFISLFWQSLAFAIYTSAMNFRVSSQFITDCASGHGHDKTYYFYCDTNKVSSSTINIYGEELPTNPCFLGHGGYFILGILSRFSQLSFVSCFLKSHFTKKKNTSCSKKESNGIVLYISLFALFIFVMAQLTSAYTSQPKYCLLDKYLVNDKSGFLSEWWGQKLTSLKQITLT